MRHFIVRMRRAGYVIARPLNCGVSRRTEGRCATQASNTLYDAGSVLLAWRVRAGSAQGGYDAYFGRYTVDDAQGTVTQHLLGALSQENVGSVLTRAMKVQGNALIIQLQTTSGDGVAVTRTLTWRRAG